MSDLVIRARKEAEAMHSAIYGECLHDTFYAYDWKDKPHRVVIDACNLVRELADRIAALEAENARLREALDQLVDDMGETGLCVCQAAKEQAIAALATKENEG